MNRSRPLSGGGGKPLAVAAQNCVEPQPAEILTAGLLIGYCPAPYVAPPDLPHATNHRMASLTIAEEIIDELAHRRAPRFGQQAAPASDGENRVQQPRHRIK